MPRSVAHIGVSVSARADQFSKGIKRAVRSLGRFEKRAKRTSFVTRQLNAATARLAGVFGTLAAARGFASFIASTEKLNRAMAQSTAIMGDLSDTMRRDLREAAIDVAKNTVFSAQEAARAFFFLASAGLDAKQSLASLPKVAQFAQAGMFDLALATDLLTDAQSALGLTSKDQSRNMKNLARVSDVLVQANTLANASVQQFSEALTTKAGAALKVLGKDIEEGVAVLAAFADQGVKAAEAGTALNIILRDLSTKAIRNTAAFEQYRIAVFDSQGEFRNLADIIGDMERALDGLSDAQQKAMLLQLGFADRSVIFIQTLLGMSERIRDYETALRDAGDTTEDVARKSITPLQESLAKLQGTMQQIADSSAPAFVEGISKVANAANVLFDMLTVLTQPGAQLGEKGIRFVSPEEERRMEQIAKLAEKLERNKDRLASRSLASDIVRGKRPPIAKTPKDLTTFANRITDIERALARVGFTDAERRLADLNEAFAKSGAIIPIDLYNRGAKAIDDLARAERDLKIQTDATNEARENTLDLMDRQERLFKSTRTPLERFKNDMRELQNLFAEGPVKGGLDTFERAIKKMSDQFVTKKTLTAPEPQVIRRSLVETTGLPSTRLVQRVEDPQLAEVIRIERETLAAIRDNAGQTALAVFAP